LEEEIDLRPYINALIRSWYWILLAGLLAGGTAYLVSKLVPDTYEAETALATIRESTDVSFNASIEPEAEILDSRNADTRLEGLVALVTSSDVATQVLAEIGDELDEDHQSVPSVINLIEASNVGDLIIIKAQYNDPQLTSQLVNTWTEVYENHINELYGTGRHTGQEKLTAQVVVANENYETAKTNLESFIANNRITFLQSEIAVQNDLMASYQEARNKIQSNPVDFQVNARQDVLKTFYSDIGRIELLLADAKSLREQVSSGNGSTAAQIANGLALISLQNRVSHNLGQSITLQLDLDLVNETTDPVRLSDINAIIDTLETRRTETLAQIETFSLSFASVEPEELIIDDNHPISQRIIELHNSILTLRAELSTETSQERELNQELDLAWSRYQTLARREKDVEISSDSSGTEVRIASNSAVPDEPVNMGGLMFAIIGLMIGSMMAVLGMTVAFWSSSNQIITKNKVAASGSGQS